MTLPQILSLSILGLLMIALIWDKFRYDVLALLALVASLAVGTVSPDEAFSGFSDDIVIIVASALLVSAALARSGIMENLIGRFFPDTKSPTLQIAFLVITVTVLSAFVKNIGALAIMLPIAFQFARQSGTSLSLFLMPMSFGALMGGMCTQIGTSPNIVVAQIRERMTGESFTMFDYAPVGVMISCIGVLYLIFFYRLLPQRRKSGAANAETPGIGDYIAEAQIPAASPIIGKRIVDLTAPAKGEAKVVKLIRNKNNKISPLPDTILAEGDIVLLEGPTRALDSITNTARLSLTLGRQPAQSEKTGEMDTVEAVITDNSPLIGLSAKKLELFDRHKVNLLAISRPHGRIRSRLSDTVMHIGDVLVLQGGEHILPPLLADLKCLPLARRRILLGSLRRGLVPLIILFFAVIATALQLLSVPIAFFCAALAMVVFRVIPGREIYQSLDGQILVMLAALIPVSEALSKTGCAQFLGDKLAAIAGHLPATGALTLILIVAMLVTPFLNNAATVMVMAPIATSFATSLHYRPEAFLMATAIGAASDFLTPIGHQCNLLVMGPGGYHFVDYPKFGLPLSLLVIIVSVPMLLWMWPV